MPTYQELREARSEYQTRFNQHADACQRFASAIVGQLYALGAPSNQVHLTNPNLEEVPDFLQTKVGLESTAVLLRLRKPGDNFEVRIGEDAIIIAGDNEAGAKLIAEGILTFIIEFYKQQFEDQFGNGDSNAWPTRPTRDYGF